MNKNSFIFLSLLSCEGNFKTLLPLPNQPCSKKGFLFACPVLNGQRTCQGNITSSYILTQECSHCTLFFYIWLINEKHSSTLVDPTVKNVCVLTQTSFTTVCLFPFCILNTKFEHQAMFISVYLVFNISHSWSIIARKYQ